MIFLRTRHAGAGTPLASGGSLGEPLRAFSIAGGGGEKADAHPDQGHGVRLYGQFRLLRGRHAGGSASRGTLLSRPLRGLAHVVALLGTAMLTACAVGPDFRVPDLPLVKSFLAGGDRDVG